MRPYSVIIMAGSRPSGDPLARHFNVPGKALIPISGKPMINHVLAPFLHRKEVQAIHVVTELGAALSEHADTKWIAGENKITIRPGGETIAASLKQLLAADDDFPYLVTTTDNVLLSDAMIDQFLQEVDGSDLGLALVERKTVLVKYPDTTRTWLKLKGGQYSGANLFYLGSDKALSMIDLWAQVEQDRKKGWKIFTIFGPWVLLMALTRTIRLEKLAKHLSKKMGLSVVPVSLDQAEACIDVDRVGDVGLVTRIIEERRAS